MPFQNVGDRATREIVAEIGQGADNPCVTPIAILTRHLHDERFDRVAKQRSTWPLACAACVPNSVRLPARRAHA